ncbi:hypothetical protein [Nocardia sienata]|uniref:hypothetical protein n=1 Tax=Nocardia sienata TaxID=248552 RepID=UPI000A9F56E9|nr:hypothetical protein [Nocardia sienata]
MPSFFRRRTRPNEPAPAPPQPPDSGTPPQDPALAQAWLCERLPLLRAKAERYGWRRELEAQVTAVRDGRPVHEALAALLLDSSATVRGLGEVPLRDVWDPRPVGQLFHCPRGVCPPRGRDQDAHEPYCHLEDRPLQSTTYRLDP